MERFLLLMCMTLSSLSIFAQFDAVKKAAEEGDVSAQMYMGQLYEEGSITHGIRQDYSKAIEWYLEAAKLGDAQAHFKASFLIVGTTPGFLQNEEVQAFVCRLLIKASDMGHFRSQAYLGALLTQLLHRYQADGFAYLLKAEKNPQATPGIYMDLGYCYYNGEGTERNLTEAEHCYQKAADAGIGQAFLYVAYCAINLRNDYIKAKTYYQKAIDANIPMGYNDMAYLYADGKGVPQDFKEAHRLVDMAISMERNNLNFWDTKGEFYLKENKLEEAANLWTKIKSMNEEFAQTTDSEFCNTMRSLMDGSVDMNIAVTNASNSNTYAVIIANENYKREEKVPFAETDGKIFKEYCNKTLGILESNIKFITDATYNDIRYVTNWLKQVITANNGQAKVIFYYAGHGIPDEATKTAYLLPVDGYGTDVSTGYSLKELYDMLSGLPSQSAMVFLDACFSGTKREGDMLASARGVAIKVKPNEPKGKLVVFSAAQGDETAYPYKEQRHGMFTYYLLKKLQETKGEATLGEISDYVTSEVRKQSIVINGKMQTPTLTSSSAIGESWRNWKLK